MIRNPFDTLGSIVADDEEGTKKKEERPPALRERIAERFLDKRQIFLWGAVTDKSAEMIVERMLFLEATDPGKPIYFFINSPGGVITSGMAIYDVMRMISSPVYTITMGMAASMGAILLTVGEKGHRYVFEHAKVMIHQPLISGQIVAPAIDIKIHAEEIKKTREELNRIIADTTGQPLTRVEKDTDRDYYLDGKGAVEYGLADKVLTDFSELGLFDTKPAKAAKPKKTK
ncbi:MAG TPA: ATP-dependent Clp protease proteolytic subunit [Turneriella sp.]|nr:ATP-dependent Clp protease proteolytic subunit [Turneriella sp.]HNE18265.1 ATP-dependent Clp protease proteolytic subunit [Turneriella sp.]